MPDRQTLAFVIVTLAATCSMALAQGRGQGQGRGQDAPSGVDRLMANDANGDGKLSRDELPERFAERIFDQADADTDGFITRKELEQLFANRGAGGREGERPDRQGRRGEGNQGRASESSFDSNMSAIQRSMRRLGRSEFNAESRERDLEMVTTVQRALLGAKASMGQVAMSEVGKAKYGDDVAGYQTAFRLKLLMALGESVTLERAILTSDIGSAKASVKRLITIRNDGHDAFQPEHEEEAHDDNDGDDAGQRPGRPGRGGRPGAGGGGRPGTGGGA